MVSWSAPRWNWTGETLTAIADMLGPARRLRARLADHPRADRDDQPGVLGDRDELDRRDQPARRMVPADQRLERADAVVLEVEQGLVVELELAALEREPQVGFELPPLLRSLVEAFLEEGVGAAARFLGAIEREVGVAQKRLAVAAVVGSDRDPDAGRRHQLVAVDRRAAARSAARISRASRSTALRSSPMPCRTTNSSPPRRPTKCPRAASRSALGHRHQQRVAGGVAQRVVDHLELVEVEAVQREQAFAALARRGTAARAAGGTWCGWEGRSARR